MMAHLDVDVTMFTYRDILRLLGAAFFAGACLGIALSQYFG